MRSFLTYSLLLLVFTLSGCTMRVIPQDVDRVDQEIKGNRGVLIGDKSIVPKVKKRKTKKTYNIEIELPMRETDRAKRKEYALEGNRGYVQTKDVAEKKEEPVSKKKGTVRLGGSKKPQVVYKAPKKSLEDADVAKEKEQEIYIVKKDDTLQKISDKVYGTTKKWKKIYDANKDILATPDVISPGQKLVIPE
ncbi:LysM peptidoglycan-binding domain-containing protein [Candidatus Omnitrophota bacterium]